MAKGVVETTVGYTGGTYPNPTYRDVCTGMTGHAEAVLVKHDPKVISYEELLPHYGRRWQNGIMRLRQDKSKEEIDRSGVFTNKAVTQIVPASTFYDADDYHQDYFEKHGGCSYHVLRAK